MTIANPSVKKPRVLYIPWDKPIHDDEAWKTLNQKFELVLYDCETEDEFIREIDDPNGRFANLDAICRSTWLKSSPYLKHFLFRGEPVKHLPDSIKIIVSSGHGYDIVDVDYLTSRGILFCNSPDSCSIATADVGTYLVMSSFRYLTFAEHCVRTPGKYYDTQILPHIAQNPSGRTLGIIGLGDIGYRVALACKALGMNIAYHNRSRKPAIEAKLNGATYFETLKELLAVSDCVLVLCPHTPETHHLINFETFKWMKPKVRLVNIARGPIVQEAAVVDALKRGQLVGAGFDVHEFEPKIHPDLLDNYKITLLPHVGVSTEDSFKTFERTCVNNLVEYFYGSGIPNTCVNKELLE
ncbi:unnamed protein product [Kuraishia capsulata CBS 1993]|uniref:D-isomer specific 2-hydroxyacid dehydrogenase NAD-binding domain-containing protein n=1 Tax=Kuraishia capsulata CBS 1993 TaxID=1382522 RepID=W6MU51_9ASCO|nr:uncharacterized protein KUCA_T00004862001 [Kuraishia capsulata CBS 1993]CDK28877.1 unnamed protein product [Kuraishia capsulata CBS 1993]